MTFAARPHASATVEAPAGAPLGTLLLVGDSYDNVGVTETATLTLNADGTFGHTNSFDDPANVAPSNWFTPTTGAVGAGYQVRFTLQSGDTWDGTPTSGVLYALSSARTLTWSLAYAASASKAATVLVEVLTSGGAPYKSGTLTVSLSNGEV